MTRGTRGLAGDIRVDVTAQRGFARHAPQVRRQARRCLELLGERPSELSVALVDDQRMRILNASWRGRDRPTDVLAFAQREGRAAAHRALLGDVVISVPTAARQAAERGASLEREILELLVHGILHLLGYDHERSPADARRMYARARKLVSALEVGLISGSY